MERIENILSRYRAKYLGPLSLLLSVIVLLEFYFVFNITPRPNDECLWETQPVTKDSVGFFFKEVKVDGVTWKAGIRDGDQLLRINGQSITDLVKATKILNSMAEGDTAVYTVARNEEIFDAKVEVKKLIQFGGLAFALLAAIWLIVGIIVIRGKETGEAQITFYRIGVALVFFATFNLLNNIEYLTGDYKTLMLLLENSWTLGSVFLPFLILKFFSIFPDKIKFFDKKWFNDTVYMVPAFIFVSLLVIKIQFVYSGKINNVILFYSIFASLSGIAIFISSFAGLIMLFYNYLKIKEKSKRKPIFVILLAYSIGIAAIIYSLILILTVSPSMRFNQPEFFVPIVLIALLPIAFGYSIFKYSLLDVSDVVKTAILYGSATIGIAVIYFVIIYVLGQSVSYAIGTKYQGIVAGIIFVAFAILFQSTKDKFQEVITKKFYPEQFAYQQILLKFSNDVVTIVGINNILKETTKTFVEALKLSVFGIALHSDEIGKCELKEAVGFDQNILKLEYDEKALMKFLQGKKEAQQPFVIEVNDFEQICPGSSELLKSIGIYTVIPLVIKFKVIGLFLFGLKYSGSRFAGKDIALLTAVANQTAVAIENARLYESERQKLVIEKDLENARKIQESLLPTVIPQVKNLDISGTMVPAMQVGGDYFDVIKVSENKVFVVVGDVSGKGFSASFYMSKLQTMMTLYCNNETTPYEVLTNINKRIYTEIEKNWFITCTVALFDSEKKEVRICRAGHTPTVVVENGLATEIIPGGIGLGMEKGELFDKHLEEFRMRLKPNQLFAFYSDGVSEAMNSINQMFGDKNFNDFLVKNFKLPAVEIEKNLLEVLKQHRGDFPQNDDITIILVKTF